MFKFITMLAYILVLVGALNWGLIGFFDFDLVATIFGEMSSASRAVYCLVGVSALISAFSAYSHCKEED